MIAYEIIRTWRFHPGGRDQQRPVSCEELFLCDCPLFGRHQLIAVRDGWGFRPLCLGENDHGRGHRLGKLCAWTAPVSASIRDIEPGEMVIIDPNGNRDGLR